MSEGKVKFTPGPWLLLTSADYGIPAVKGFDPKDGKRFEICECWGEDNDVSTTEMSRANAALIAAAPDMYAVLKELIECEDVSIYSSAIESNVAGHFFDLEEWADRAVVALAKARGEAV